MKKIHRYSWNSIWFLHSMSMTGPLYSGCFLTWIFKKIGLVQLLISFRGFVPNCGQGHSTLYSRLWRARRGCWWRWPCPSSPRGRWSGRCLPCRRRTSAAPAGTLEKTGRRSSASSRRDFDFSSLIIGQIACFLLFSYVWHFRGTDRW